MSNAILPDTAKIECATRLLAAAGSFVKMRLFQTNLIVDHTTTIADLIAAICTFSGYADYTLTGGAVSPGLDAEARAFITWDANTWTKTGATGNLVYGYWIESATPEIQLVEKFDNPIPLLVDGAFVQMTPKFTVRSQYLNS
jgi:hypothetical protein